MKCGNEAMVWFDTESPPAGKVTDTPSDMTWENLKNMLGEVYPGFMTNGAIAKVKGWPRQDVALLTLLMYRAGELERIKDTPIYNSVLYRLREDEGKLHQLRHMYRDRSKSRSEGGS